MGRDRERSWSPKGLANMLTILRICVIPLFLFAFAYGHRHATTERTSAAWFYFGALVVFGLASITDYLDGRIARARGITDFGKFLDPIADKLLVLATLYAFKHWGGLVPLWMILIMAGREVGVTVLRSALLARGGRVISASQWGKMKTASQMTILIVSMLVLIANSAAGYPVSQVQTNHGPIFWMMMVPLALTVVSGLEFLYNNRTQFRALAVRS
jgi:CDP-diacylglycerol---glycerol-3-phosphate 3-phosphatidyltransferase